MSRYEPYPALLCEKMVDEYTILQCLVTYWSRDSSSQRGQQNRHRDQPSYSLYPTLRAFRASVCSLAMLYIQMVDGGHYPDHTSLSTCSLHFDRHVWLI
jgi:hypothetical protein